MSKEDDGRRLLCTNCEELTGKGTGLPSLRCSRCQAANYCSAACQRAHWKAHKVHCKLHQQKQTRDDEHALSNPQLAAMKADLVSFDSDINFALCGVAYRSAFQLGHPGQCNDTHYLDLWFSWDSKPKERRDRFKLHWAGLRKFEDAEIELRSEWIIARRFEREKLQGCSSVTVRLVACNKMDLENPVELLRRVSFPRLGSSTAFYRVARQT
ncbi:hypothetical protein BCR35DRAFT_107865 [Leucosporidium creatinivorum]|uniref:MYND-type domain-containing protein n=1 Tax=Leucosporidium creatinivorum TaxID=106004 RepID=A0A1Y2G1R0_9BASI|nr:hypothetical protein BCR35DRAFT_107865 [Leucosporidium creatinivorum]